MFTRVLSRQRTSNPRSHSCQFLSSYKIRACLFAALTTAIVGIGFPADSFAQTKNDDWLKEGLPDKILGKKKEEKKDPDGIPGTARMLLERKIIPAIQAGDEPAFLHAMNTLVSSQPQPVIDAVEKFGAKNKLGSLKEKFSNSLIKAVSTGMPIETKSLKPGLVEYATSGISKLVEDEIAELEKHFMMQNPLQLPISWIERERVFWDVHVWKNRFMNVNRLVAFSKEIQKPLLDRAVKADSEDDIDNYRKVFDLEKRVRSIFRDMTEREAELRFQMLVDSEKTLREAKAADKRINAAFALQLSGAELDLLFRKQKPGSFEREKLNDPDILKECEALIASGKKHGQDAIQKSVLLRTGAHWWLRGRYGNSIEAFGLLKPRTAMTSKAMMHGLFMPKQRPEAIGFVYPETGSESTGFDRRHFYTWAIEQRDVIRQNHEETYTSSETSNIGQPSASSFW